MDSINSNRSYTGLVQKYIGTAYDHVKNVSDNLEDVIAVGSIDGIEDIVENINAAEAHALAAAQSAIEAADSAAEADVIVSAFNDFYLGPFGIPPTTNNDGNPLTVGALYLDTATSPNLMMFWDSIQWKVSYADPISISHGAFGGLADDDHTQYLNDTRHAAITGNPHNNSLIDLTDTPATLTGAGLKGLRVAANELSIEFVDVGTDYLPISGGAVTGPITTNSYITSSLAPFADDHLIRKDYADNNFVPLVGNSNIAGTITLTHEVKIVSDGTDPYTGFTLYEYVDGVYGPSTGDILRGGFDWLDDSATDGYHPLHIWQHGKAAGVGADTVVTIVDGNVQVTSHSGLSTLATVPSDLTTKEFCDSVYAKTTENLTIEGSVTGEAFHVINGNLDVVMGEVGIYEGLAIYKNNKLQAAFDWDSVSGATQLIQYNAAGTEVTTLIEMREGQAILSSAAGGGYTNIPIYEESLTPKKYVDDKFINTYSGSYSTHDGKTVTVVNGLITSVV